MRFVILCVVLAVLGVQGKSSLKAALLKDNKILAGSWTEDDAGLNATENMLKADNGFAYAADINQAAARSNFDCLRQSGYATVFVRAYKPDGPGAVDYAAVPNINAANQAGLGVELYITPNPTSSKTGNVQVDETVTALIKAGISVKTLWIQVFWPIVWTNNQIGNMNFINAAINRIRARGIRAGVYTSFYDWQQITNQSKGLGNDVMLWYWSVYGTGVTAESVANFADFRPFGNWQTAVVKQYAQVEPICGIWINKNVYSVNSLNSASINATNADTASNDNHISSSIEA